MKTGCYAILGQCKHLVFPTGINGPFGLKRQFRRLSNHLLQNCEIK